MNPLLLSALAPAPVLAPKIEVQRLRTVRLYGKLGAQFGRVHQLAVANPAEAVQALIALHPGFEKFLMEAKDHGMGFTVFVGKRNLTEKSLTHPCGNDDIRIAPVLLGSKNSGWLNVILGVVLIVVGIAVTALSYGWAAPVGGALIGMGVSMIVGGVIQLLSPQPKLKKPSERADNTPSYNFSGPVNTTAQGHPVPLLYGELIVGSAVASAGIDIDDHGYTPTTSVPSGGGRAWTDPDGNVQIIGASGGSGSKQQRTPIEAPDSLHSTALMRILDVWTEGPIEGLVNGLQSVYLNETPLQNQDGSLNFQRVSIDWRLGTQDQDAIAGFDSVKNEIGVGTELKQPTPWTQSITNKQLDAIAIRLSVPTLAQTNTSNGDTNGGSVSFKIELSTDGGAFQTVVTDTITGKTTSKYERQHRIDLPRATSGWVVRVTRLTADSTSQTNISNTFIESYTEIVDAKLRYPNTAHCGILIDAQQFQSAPSRAYHLRGRNTIKVPSNYDPATRTYSGAWDGTFKPAYTNNPAWVFYDLILHPRYGLGRKVTASQINKWALYTIARYCDELVPNGLGGTEPRMTCNVYLQTKEDAYKVLQDLAGAFASMVYWAGGMVHAVCDMPTDPVYQYTPANVVEGKFEYSGSSKQARHTAAMVTWNNPANFYKPEPVYVPDDAGIARYGLNLVEVQAIGCTSIGQAMRYGRRLLATERMQTDVVSFGVGLDGASAVPGQVVKIADPLRLGQRLGGRISAATSNSIIVDKLPDTLPVAGDTLNVVGSDGALISGAIASVDAVTKTIVMAAAFASLPVPQSIWSVERSNLSAAQYRILTVTRPKNAQYALTAIKHEPEKYAYIDADVPIVGKKTVEIDLADQVTAITLSKFDRTTDYTTETVVAADWEKPANAVAYDVQWKKDDGNWSAPVRQSESHSEYLNAKPGSYAVRVACVNAAGFTGVAFTSDAFVILDDQPAPAVIADMQADAALQASRISQEIVDRQADVIAMGQQAADDATAKANAALATAQAQADAIQAQLNDFTGQADDWSNATAYPVGDFVKDSGKLYRAIQDVPAGTALTNTAYWEQLGNYSSVGDVIAAAISMSTANASDIAAEASARQALSTKMTGLADPSGATLPTLTSGLIYDERQSRSAADAAEVTARQGLSAKLTGFSDPTGKTLSDLTSGLIYDEKTARASADSAEVASRQALSATLTGMNDPSGKTLADLTSGIIYDEKTARASADSAEASARSALAAVVNDPTTGLANAHARITSEASARSAADSAASSRMDTMDATIAGKASASITDARFVSVESAAAGGNLLPNSGFLTSLRGWQSQIYFTDGSAGLALERDYAGSSWVPVGGHQIGFSVPGTLASNVYGDFYSPTVPVQEGKKYAVSARLAEHRSVARLFLIFMDASGNFLSSPYCGQTPNPNQGGQNIASWDLLQGVFQAPSGARKAMLLWRCISTGEANPYFWMCQPQICEAVGNANVAPPYSPGGNEASAQVTLTTDVNGRITGYNIANDGTTGIFEVVADQFKITNPNGGARTEFSNGNWRVYDSAGTLRVQMGVW